MLNIVICESPLLQNATANACSSALQSSKWDIKLYDHTFLETEGVKKEIYLYGAAAAATYSAANNLPSLLAKHPLQSTYVYICPCGWVPQLLSWVFEEENNLF